MQDGVLELAYLLDQQDWTVVQVEQELEHFVLLFFRTVAASIYIFQIKIQEYFDWMHVKVIP